MCRSEGCPLPPPLCPAVAPVLPADMPSHQLTKPMKARLPRKLANSARINLNKYWHALEELIPVNRKVFDEADSNAINENIDNERRLAAMQLSETQQRDIGGSSTSLESMDSNNVFQSGKNFSDTSSFPKFPSESSFPKAPQFSFPKTTSASSFSMTVEGPSDENTPPSTCSENTSR